LEFNRSGKPLRHPKTPLRHPKTPLRQAGLTAAPGKPYRCARQGHSVIVSHGFLEQYL
jgi:hypothetical protein